jgi:hypothetical protein
MMMIDERRGRMLSITSVIQADRTAVVNAGPVGKLCTNSG